MRGGGQREDPGHKLRFVKYQNLPMQINVAWGIPSTTHFTRETCSNAANIGFWVAYVQIVSIETELFWQYLRRQQ